MKPQSPTLTALADFDQSDRAASNQTADTRAAAYVYAFLFGSVAVTFLWLASWSASHDARSEAPPTTAIASQLDSGQHQAAQ